MPERTGTVRAKNQYGVMLDQDEEWLNWTKPEWRSTPWEADSVVKGDVVELTLDDTGKFIKAVQRIAKAQDVTPPVTGSDGAEQAMGGITGEPNTQWGFEQKDKLMLWESVFKSLVMMDSAYIAAGKDIPPPQLLFDRVAALVELIMKQEDL